MRVLFEMDKHDYDHCTHNFVRNSARSIIISGKKIAMIHSLKYDYYKFPGGGIEGEESPVAAMIRETREEAGLVVKPETVKEFGIVHRIQKSDKDPSECFVQDNYYAMWKMRLFSNVWMVTKRRKIMLWNLLTPSLLFKRIVMYKIVHTIR